MQPALSYLRFGIPTLDFLLSPLASKPSEYGIHFARSELNPSEPSEGIISLSFIGRSGAGKSLLGLHLASRYLADGFACAAKVKELRFTPKVFYVSTDLTYPRALMAWKEFDLDKPNARRTPFGEHIAYSVDDSGERGALNNDQLEELRSLRVSLTQCAYGSDKLERAVQGHAGNGNNPQEVYFVDLASSTSGDDWGLIGRILALLEPNDKGAPKHLLVIDAVEGLETFSGSVDSHGRDRSRRSRIAQVLRTAVEKCHVAFILEESREGEIPAEEYVTDVVLRLRATERASYMRRTLEIAKSRGGTHVRGQHNYFIRDGNGTSGTPDDPRNLSGGHPTAYIHVVHSLHCLTRTKMQHWSADDSPRSSVSRDYAGIITPKLGNILPQNGLPRGQVTVLTGDEATHKARLGRAFLAGAFPPVSIRPKEVAVYVTTHNLSKNQCLELLRSHIPAPPSVGGNSGSETWLEADVNERFIFRQLEAHNLDSPTLFNILRRCVEEGIQRSARSSGDPEDARRSWWAWSPNACRVRLVIDDWTIIKRSYPQIAEDSLFLPFLVRYLVERGVTTLVVETGPGRPVQIFSGEADSQLRSLTRSHLLSWHVRFYGVDRVAIAAIPPLEDAMAPSVSEIGPVPHDMIGDKAPKSVSGERLWGDPHFELYMGLETGNPEPVALEVHLFAEGARFDEYNNNTNELLNRIFAAHDRSHGVIKAHKPSEYAMLREFSLLHGGVRADHTVALQVDEYWRPVRQPPAPQYRRAYLDQPSTDDQGHPHAIDDPFLVYQHEVKFDGSNQLRAIPRRFYKGEFFHLDGYPQDYTNELNRMRLVPYYWDFGFLLLRLRPWRAAVANEMQRRQPWAEYKVPEIQRVWEYCTGPLSGKASKTPVNWCDFLQVCQLVAQLEGSQETTPAPVFDLDLLSPQTLACLVLEMWASEIKAELEMKISDLKSKKQESRPPEQLDQSIADLKCQIDELFPGERSDRSTDNNLVNLLTQYPVEFFRIWLLLGEVVTPAQILDPQGKIQCRAAKGVAIAERHWYSTASQAAKRSDITDSVVPARLPGSYSTRGDWFLTVGPESRSGRLGDRAIDLLSRRRMNIARLELGIGLPVRDLVEWDPESKGLSGSSPLKKSFHDQLLTALMNEDGESGSRRPISYSDLCGLGASSHGPVRWLWRSRIKFYHRHDTFWEKSLARLLAAAARWNQYIKSHGENGFRAYAQLAGKCDGFKASGPLAECRTEFQSMIEIVKGVLRKLMQPPIA